MSEEFLSHIHLDTSERSKLLCRLDEAPSAQSGRDRRRWRRWEYRICDIAVLVSHPGGGSGRYLVCARNISSGGLSFIHGGFIHTGSECRFILPRTDGTPMAIAGVVMYCRHIERSHHEIGVQFLEEIDPSLILPESMLEEQQKEQDSVELPTLEGHVLVVDQSRSHRRLMAHHLKATGATLRMVDTPGAALDAIRRRVFDIVVCDLNLESDAVRMISSMRSAGYRGPILVVTADSDIERLVAARDAGANEIIGKPYSPAVLAGVLAEWLDAPCIERPIYSSLEDKPGMADLIVEFIQHVGRKAPKLERVLVDGEIAELREMVVEIVGAGAGYGFETLTEAARDALMAMDSAKERTDVEGPVRRLLGMMGRLRCGTASRPGGWNKSVA